MDFLWFLCGNVSGAIIMTAIWAIIGTYSNNKNNTDNKGE